MRCIADRGSQIGKTGRLFRPLDQANRLCDGIPIAADLVGAAAHA
jgi:hypothetical protein